MNNHRLGYQRLSEALIERGLVEAQAVQDALGIGSHGGVPFPEALVSANLVSDWELSNVVCQLYGLPFLPVEICEPHPDAAKGLDLEFLLENGIVPLSRHGQVLTLCMPAIVPAEILGCIAAESDLFVLPVVGTVNSNRRWLQNNYAPEATMGAPGSGDDSDWGSLFDEADAAVLSELEVIEPDPDEMDDMGGLGDLGDDIPALDFDAADIEATSSSKTTSKSAASLDLPPPPPRSTGDSDTIV
jgi:hypothetical protein